MIDAIPNISRRCRWMWRRNLLVWTKFYKSSIVANVGEPLLYLLGLGYGFGPMVSSVEGVSYMQFIAPGLLAYTAMNSASFECTFGAYARMTTQKTYDAIISTPMNIDEVVAGEVMFASTKAVFASLVMMLFLALFGLIPSVAAALAPIAVGLTGFVFASMAMLFTSFARSWDFFSYYFTLFMAPMYFLSGVFFPLSNLPEWVQTLAFLTPLYHSVELSRGLVMGDLNWGMLQHVIVLGVIGAAAFMLAVARIKKRLMV
ncbi:MAG: ABC transporter permease [Deltaproteobacteria bacterium]